MTLLKMIRNPFMLIGQGFILGGMMVVALQDAPPAHAAALEAAEARR